MTTQIDKEFEETYKLYVKQRKDIQLCRAICEDLKEDTIPASPNKEKVSG